MFFFKDFIEAVKLVLTYGPKTVKDAMVYDPLTGAYGRRYIEELAGRALAYAKRYQHPVSIAIVDLDNFKEVNDTQGHAGGGSAFKPIWLRSQGFVAFPGFFGAHRGR